MCLLVRTWKLANRSAGRFHANQAAYLPQLICVALHARRSATPTSMALWSQIVSQWVAIACQWVARWSLHPDISLFPMYITDAFFTYGFIPSDNPPQ